MLHARVAVWKFLVFASDGQRWGFGSAVSDARVYVGSVVELASASLGGRDVETVGDLRSQVGGFQRLFFCAPPHPKTENNNQF